MSRAWDADLQVSPREAEVLALIAGHLTNAEIAEQLYISVRTVESHVTSLLRKLRLPDRRSLARHVEATGPARPRTRSSPLPSAVTPFIGRRAERASLQTALAQNRMVTVTGPGGTGKTRLALCVAEDLGSSYRDGLWFVDLVQLADPAMVVASVAKAIGVPEQWAGSLSDAVVDLLAQRHGLLILDNCEHVLDGVRDCAEQILAGCPAVTVLATSRIRLLVAYEWVYSLAGLSVDDDDRGGDAVDLFTTRVAAAGAGPMPLDPRRVAALCRALDGMALAIELAAARCPSLGLDGLESGLDDRLRHLAGGTRVASRHQSLRHALAWSYDLLTPDDRALLRTVAVFASRFDVDAALALIDPPRPRAEVADGLARLADHSLLVVEPGEPTRYRALETIRQYGGEQLKANGEEAIRRARHGQWCLAATTTLAGEEPDDAWCERFDRVAADIRAALVWSTTGDEPRPEAFGLAAGLASLLFTRGRPAEAQHRYEQAAELAPTGHDRAAMLRMAAGAASARYVGNDTVRLLREAAAVSVAADDRAGAAYDLAWAAIYMLRAPGIMAVVPEVEEGLAAIEECRSLSDGSAWVEAAMAAGVALSTKYTSPSAQDATSPAQPPRPYPACELVGSAAALQASLLAVRLASEASDPVLESAALDGLCVVHIARDELAEALRVVDRRAEVMQQFTADAWSGFEVNDVLLMASEIHLATGDLRQAAIHADALAGLAFYRDEEHLALARRLKVDAFAGHLSDAAARGELFRQSWERAGRPVARNLAMSTYAVAMVFGLLGDDERRQQWVEITVALGATPERLAGCESGWAPTYDALVALDRSEPQVAMERLSADIDDNAIWTTSNAMLWRPWYAALWAEAAVLAHHPDAANRLERSRAVTSSNPIAARMVERAAAIATGDHSSLAHHASTFAALACPYQVSRTRALLEAG